jgi:hypothetical protein
MYDLLVEWIVVEQRVESRERDLRLEADIVVLFQYIGLSLRLRPPKPVVCGWVRAIQLGHSVWCKWHTV